MRKYFGGLPPRYPALLRLTLSAALFRLAPLAPAALAYFLLPVGSWFRLLLLLCPALWVWAVCPARARYGQTLAAFAKDPSAPLSARALTEKNTAWQGVCRGRARRMRRHALPLLVLLAALLLLFIYFGAFSALRILLGAFGPVAAALGTAAMLLPRLLTGEAVVQQASPLGAMGVLAAALGVCLFLFSRGAFRTSAYRFGFTAGLPEAKEMRPLFRQNLRLWLPTLVLFGASLIVSYRELGLLFANVLGAAPLFTVKLRIPQIVLLSLTAASYLVLLPVRKYNTAVWAVKRGESGMRN